MPRPSADRGTTEGRDPASYRDPAGFVYRRDGILYRQVSPAFADEWGHFERSGLRGRLVEGGLLIGHEEAPLDLAAEPPAAAVIRPELIPFVSYPYEWSFSQLRDAALLTLRAQAMAMETGMTLRDASAYNVQFRASRPVLIDSLSFERAVPGAPWVAYRQFCEHFLAPLALMARVDVRLGGLLRTHLEGIPLDLAARLLPRRTRLSLGLGTHIHLHARAQRRYADRPVAVGEGSVAGGPASPAPVGTAPPGVASSPHAAPSAGRGMSPSRQAALLESLRTTVEKLEWRPEGTTWADYADNTSYDDDATRAKERLVGEALAACGGSRVWDLGANTGRYSRIAAGLGRTVLAFDSDPAAVERGYRAIRSEGRTDILPLLMDLVDPSPGTGWAGAERRSLLERADADVVMALALVHHLAIGRNVPLPMLADLFAALGHDLVLEFVPKEDAMVVRLLSSRRDVFPDYSLAGLRAAFERRFEPVSESPIEGTTRTLLHLRRRAD